MKILLHACCAPCSTYCVKELEQHEVTLFWFNPNIHPFTEYKKRLDSMRLYGEKSAADLLVKDDYPLKEFISGALNSDNRCLFCYTWRLNETARSAKDAGFDVFSTTLTLSPYQDHDLIKKSGLQAEETYGVEFLYIDMREGFRESHQMAREVGLYLQKYCGCIFSEAERYKKNQLSSR